MNYSIYHVEKYGHGKHEFNTLADDKKVTIADNDGYYDVYECETDEEAEKIANWYVSAAYESYPAQVTLKKQNDRYFSIEADD